MKTGRNTTQNKGNTVIEIIFMVGLLAIGINLAIQVYKFDKTNREILKQRDANQSK
jgi:hypothetical protein